MKGNGITVKRALIHAVLVSLLLGASMVSCIPASVTRIGPPRPPRKSNCEVLVLSPGKTPERPWVDIGAIMVQNCQEYHVGLCRKWVIQKACELGGEIVYLPEPSPPKDEFNNINYRVLTAIYAVKADDSLPISSAGCSEPKPATDKNAPEPEPLGRCIEE